VSYRFDPELAPWVAMISNLDLTRPAAARAEMETAAAARAELPLPAARVSDHVVPAGAGGAEVAVRVYAPVAQSGAPRPGILFLHSGGFVLGSVTVADSWTRRLAVELDAVVVSVGYRLAPEHPYPAALEDSYSALEWMAKQVSEFGIDGDRIAVAGESAGAALATALTMLVRDRGGPAICFQSLAIPAVDDRLDSPSMRQFVDTPMWNRPNAEISWRAYLGPDVVPGTPEVPALAAPARVQDLRGLPPAFVSASEFDPLRDEGIAYAQRLTQAGVPTELHLYPGTFHGSRSIEHAAVSRRMTDDILGALRRALSAPS
jgi:acetyl esterase